MPQEQSLQKGITVPTVIGHRGAAGYAPENTLASIRKAADIGIQWVEFDVRLTRDGQPILLHDETLQRTTDGHGNVSAMDFSELQGLDAGQWFGPNFSGESIPSLSETLKLLAQLNVGANVEIKSIVGREVETGHSVASQLLKEWPGDLTPPLISSFSREVLAAAKEEAPSISRALIVGQIPNDWRDDLEQYGCEGLHCNHKHLTRDGAEQIIKAGYSLRAYTVNDNKRAQSLFDWGVGSVFSDYPDRIQTNKS